ncbi:MarR family winged helix-turn-helix transcriptional regulator, partial [Kineococcus glutinatus]|uniref:MarR family winged helix-turn-helix transcriptional regulator n=1 Tax=Kineococcus glutinatus TaxID=1070872 RepID=UPI0031EB0C9F
MDQQQAEAINTAIRTIAIRSRARAAALLADVGLHPGQDALLLRLAERGACTQAQLAEASGCEAPVVTVTARKLEAAGLISRSPSPTDRRSVLVRLTAAGEEAVRRVRDVQPVLAREAVEGLEHTSAAELLAVLEDLSRSLCRAGRGGGAGDAAAAVRGAPVGTARTAART